VNLLAEGLQQICVSNKTACLLIGNRLQEITEIITLYMDEIERFNHAYGLVNIAGREELIIRHILDSLSPLGQIAGILGAEASPLSGTTLADVGAGAGLPGIPLAICLPGVRITLIERMGRRAGFLRNVIAVLGLSGHVIVEETELEKTSGSFDVVTFRAVSPLTPGFVASLARLLRPPQGAAGSGIIAAYKGKRITAEAELSLLGKAYASELVPLTVPFMDEERFLALISAIRALPDNP